MKLFDFMRPARYFFILSTTLTVLSIVLAVYPGPRLSIEFTGGTRMEFVVPDTVTVTSVSTAMKSYGAETNAIVNKAHNGHIIIRTKNLEDAEHTALVNHLKSALGPVEEVQYNTIGPTVGSTLKKRAAIALAVASLGIVLYLAWAFRSMPRKYGAWKFGIVAVFTLLHDVMVTVGIFVILSYYTNFEVDTLFITALLTILGYSVNDTIIIFDRIRDNVLIQERREQFRHLANAAINQSWKRSCYTSGSTLIMLLALFFLGSSSIQWFVLTLIVGIVLGTYSSVFVATPLLVYWVERSKHGGA